VPAGGRVGGVRRQQLLPVELAARIGRGDDEQRAAGGLRGVGGGRRRGGDDPVRGDPDAAFLEPAASVSR
jgi:hypothetical protein